jgi:hypothetical protein
MSGVDIVLIFAALFAFATSVWAAIEWIQYWRLKKKQGKAR